MEIGKRQSKQPEVKNGDQKKIVQRGRGEEWRCQKAKDQVPRSKYQVKDGVVDRTLQHVFVLTGQETCQEFHRGHWARFCGLRMFLPSIYVSLKFVMQFSHTEESSSVHCLIDSHCLTISLLALFSSCSTADFSSFRIGLQQRIPIAMNIRHSTETSLLPAISNSLEFQYSNYKSTLGSITFREQYRYALRSAAENKACELGDSCIRERIQTVTVMQCCQSVTASNVLVFSLPSWR